MGLSKSALDPYQKLYVDLRFERRELFELIQQEYQPREVLYPGCSVHITPAFYFPHVVFVDQDPAAQDFFSNPEIVLDFVRRHRLYRRQPFIQFIFQDFTTPLPFSREKFDLVLAIFTGGVSKACSSYLKIGGLLLTNNHQDDALDAAQDDQLTLIASVRTRRGRYHLETSASDHPVKIPPASAKSKRYLRQVRTGAEYIENETYYIFRRIRPAR